MRLPGFDSFAVLKMASPVSASAEAFPVARDRRVAFLSSGERAAFFEVWSTTRSVSPWPRLPQSQLFKGIGHARANAISTERT